MSLNIKKIIKGIVHEKAPGPSTSFSMFHVVYALELISEKSIGRSKLAKQLEVGEGVIRTIINHLKEAKLITTSKQGCKLSNKGLELWRSIEEVFPYRVEVKRTILNNSKYSFAFLVKNSGHKIKSGIVQRDAAIMGGARRSIAIVAKNNKLAIDSVSDDIKKDFPDASKKLLKNIFPENNDVIIVAGADSAIRAKRGAFAASWVLIN
jgi:predicted transcriptional regulator